MASAEKNKIIEKQLIEAIGLLLQTIPSWEAHILRLRFGLLGTPQMSYEDIGYRINRSPAEVEEIEINALRMLRGPDRTAVVKDILHGTEFEEPHKRELPVELSEVIETVSKLTSELINHLRIKEDDLSKLPPNIFEHLIAEFFASFGFEDVRLVGRNPKTSADLFAAYKISPIDTKVRYFVEVKRWKQKVGVEIIDQVYGAMLNERPSFGWTAALIVSLIGFKDFRKYERSDLALKGIELKQKSDLLRWLKDYKPNKNGLWLPNPETSI